MLRWILILTLVLSPLPTSVGATPTAQAPAAPCCCCSGQVCQCGCDEATSADEPAEIPSGQRFCGCDDAPLTLPTGSANMPQLRVPAAMRTGAVLLSPGPDPGRRQLVQRAHGPPAALASLATIILLN